MDKIDLRLVQAVVLLQRQRLLTLHLVERYQPLLDGLEATIDSGTQGINDVLDAYNYVFGLVDHLVRFQKVAFACPRLNQKEEPFQKLNEALGNLKSVRNQIQHINNDLENEFTGPLLGTICWGAGSRQYAVTFHDLGRERSSVLTAFDAHGDGFPSHFHYIYEEETHDLGRALRGMEEFADFIQKKVAVSVDGHPYDPKGHFAAFRISIRPVESESEDLKTLE